MARSKTGIHYSAEDNRNGFLFALPWIIGFICFSIIPLATSFYQLQPGQGPCMGWSGQLQICAE